MLIDGKWVEAASGKTFETLNPATGEVLAAVAEGDGDDIDRAVAAARAAFDGPWSKFKPYERQTLLLKLADLVERHFDELAASTRSTWARRSAAPAADRQRALGMLRYYAGMAAAIHGETIENSLPGEYRVLHAEGAGRRRRRDHPVERPARRLDLEDRPGAGDRLHGGAEARRGGAADAAAPGRAVPGGRRAARRRQRRHRLSARPPARRWPSHPDVDKVAFTGSHLTGQKIVQALGRQPQARVAGARAASRPTSCSPMPTSTQAVPGAGMAVFANSGQICSAGTRLFVERKIYDEFVGRVAEFSKYAARRRRQRSGDAGRAAGLAAAARPRHRLSGDRPAGRCAPAVGRRAADRRRDGARATSCRRRCSPTCATTCASRRRRSSAR